MQPLSAADYHDIAIPSEPQLSPDGTQIVFCRTEPLDDEQYESTLYCVDVDGGEPRRLTLAEGRDAEPRYSPSGDRIAFTATRGADDDRAQLWVLSLDGGEARQVTNVVGNVSEIVWAPDGDRIAFVQSVTEADREADRDLRVPDEYEPPDHPDPRVVERTVYRSQEQYFDGRRSGVYLVNADATADGARTDPDPPIERLCDRLADGDEAGADTDGATTELTAQEFATSDVGGPEFGDADTLYVRRSVGDDPDDSDEIAIYAHDLPSGRTEQIHTTTGWQTDLAATADGRIAFTRIEPEQASLQPTELHVLDREAESVTELTADIDRGLDYGTTPEWGPDGEAMFFATVDRGATAIWQVPADGSQAPERVIRQGTVSGFAIASGSNASDEPTPSSQEAVRIALTRSEWDHPGDVFVYDTGTEEPTQLTRLNHDLLADRDVGEPTELWFDSGDTEIQGWVLTPPNAADDDPSPLVVEIHGGPHAMWSTAGTMWHEFQTLAARGYTVFWSNPRGSAGYGAAHRQAIERDWGDATLTDVLAGVDVVIDRWDIDESNTFVTGGSFGGFMTAWTVGQTARFRAAVAQRGVYDLTGFYGSTDGAYKLLEGDFDTDPTTEPGWLWSQSPTGHVESVDTPTLLIHSEDDTRTPICTAELYHRLLQKQGVETRFVRYPREGHELSRSGEPGHIVDRIERIARWFDGYSDHHDVPPALDRPADAGLSASASDDEDDA